MFSSPITTKNFSESAIAITTTPSTMITSQPSMQHSLSEIKTQPATYNVKSTPSKIYCFPTAIIPLPETSPSSTYFLPKSNVIQHLTVETKIIPKSPITESKVEPTNFHIKEPPLSKNKTDYFNKSSLASPTGNLTPRLKFSTVCPLAKTSTKKSQNSTLRIPTQISSTKSHFSTMTALKMLVLSLKQFTQPTTLSPLTSIPNFFIKLKLQDHQNPSK
jgi:hypothetical protein